MSAQHDPQRNALYIPSIAQQISRRENRSPTPEYEKDDSYYGLLDFNLEKRRWRRRRSNSRDMPANRYDRVSIYDASRDPNRRKKYLRVQRTQKRIYKKSDLSLQSIRNSFNDPYAERATQSRVERELMAMKYKCGDHCCFHTGNTNAYQQSNTRYPYPSWLQAGMIGQVIEEGNVMWPDYVKVQFEHSEHWVRIMDLNPVRCPIRPLDFPDDNVEVIKVKRVRKVDPFEERVTVIKRKGEKRIMSSKDKAAIRAKKQKTEEKKPESQLQPVHQHNDGNEIVELSSGDDSGVTDDSNSDSDSNVSMYSLQDSDDDGKEATGDIKAPPKQWFTGSDKKPEDTVSGSSAQDPVGEGSDCMKSEEDSEKKEAYDSEDENTAYGTRSSRSYAKKSADQAIHNLTGKEMHGTEIVDLLSDSDSSD